MIDKKGMSVMGYVIAAVVAIVILFLLFVPLGTQGSIFNSVTSGFSGDTNIDSLKQACTTQCELGQKASYCSTKRIVDTEGSSRDGTCADDSIKPDTCEMTCDPPADEDNGGDGDE